jgi:hypothetical protein
MKPTDSETTGTELERRSRELLLASTAALEARVRSRLTQARHAALAELGTRAGTRLFRVPGAWLPAGAVTAAAVLAVAVWLAQPATGPAGASLESSPVEDAEILASNDGPDLVADDADFYEWAGTDAAAATQGNAG